MDKFFAWIGSVVQLAVMISVWYIIGRIVIFVIGFIL